MEKLASFTCGHPPQRLFKEERIDEERLVSVWAVCAEWLHFLSGFFTVTTTERKKEMNRQRRSGRGAKETSGMAPLVPRPFFL